MLYSAFSIWLWNFVHIDIFFIILFSILFFGILLILQGSPPQPSLLWSLVLIAPISCKVFVYRGTFPVSFPWHISGYVLPYFLRLLTTSTLGPVLRTLSTFISLTGPSLKPFISIYWVNLKILRQGSLKCIPRSFFFIFYNTMKTEWLKEYSGNTLF